MQKPSPGRIVMTRVSPHENNGSDEAPAVITRVLGEHPHGGWAVNLRVFTDSANNPPRVMSIRLTDERPRVNGDDLDAAWWPPRVS
jgi:hypothetical protein